MTTVLTLLHPERVHAAVRSALRDTSFHGPLRVGRMESWGELVVATEEGGVALVLFDPGHPGIGKGDRVARTVARHPATTFVLLCGDPQRLHPQEVLDLGRAGVRTAITAGIDDHPDRLRALVTRAIASGATERLLGEVELRLPPEQAELIRFIARHAPYAPRLQDFARRVNVSTRTLERRAGDAGLSSPARVLSWVHLYNACTALRSREGAWREASGPVGFSSGSSFRRALKRVVGLTKTEVRGLPDQGSLARVFARALAGPLPPVPPVARRPELARWLSAPEERRVAAGGGAPTLVSQRVPPLSRPALSPSGESRP